MILFGLTTPQQERYDREVEILTYLAKEMEDQTKSRPPIVQYFTNFETIGYCFIVEEFLRGDSLLYYNGSTEAGDKAPIYSESVAQVYARQILTGIEKDYYLTHPSPPQSSQSSSSKDRNIGSMLCITTFSSSYSLVFLL